MERTMLISVLSLFALTLFAQAPEQESPSECCATPQMQQMQAGMQAMHALMEQIRATEDPEERRRLMQAHMQSMHQGMSMMGAMMRGPMGQGRAQGGPMQQQCEENDVQCRMDRMQMQQGTMAERMGMMQQMMQQMMEHMMQGQAADQTAAQPAPSAERHDEHH